MVVDTFRNLKLSYEDLFQQTENFKKQLVQGFGIKRGDCISLVALNSVDFVITFLGTALMGCISAPLNPNFTASEFEFYLADSKSRAVVVQKRFLTVSDEPAIVKVAKKLGVQLISIDWKASGASLEYFCGEGERTKSSTNSSVHAGAADTCLLLHTSGTTGRPKAVPLSHQNLLCTMKNIVNTYQLTMKDTSYIVMPLFHVHGLIGALLSTLLSGGSAIIPPKFSASVFWKEFGEYGCTWYSAVPTIHQVLLNVASPPEGITPRFIRSCSSSLAPATFFQLEKKFKAPVLEAYAMTEAAHQMTSNPLPPAARKPGSVGIPQGVQVHILDQKGDQAEEGEVCIRGPNVTVGYLNNAEANRNSFTKDGFFRTGDQGKLDADGYLFLTGRIKELINRGGEKISPLELDSVLLSHSDVAEAVAFGVPDAKYGQEVHAVIRLHAGCKPDELAMRQHCLKSLAEFKVPKKFYFTSALPKTATGKIQRRKMVDHFFNKSKL
ncbi:hypothetical protein L0F63_006256 [Massospora cicadina]|nr:hypothetical protein L0F63_006256 [Massospora cicadina]